MNKRRVDALIPEAYGVLQEVGIAKEGKVDKAWKGQIASFGAAIATGSLLAAVSFFSTQEQAKLPRERLMKAIFRLIKDQNQATNLFEYVLQCNNDTDSKRRMIKENIVNSAIALKLAMNLYEPE